MTTTPTLPPPTDPAGPRAPRVRRAGARARRGMAAVLAMMFLVLVSSIATAMYAVATTGTTSTRNLMNNDRARAAAESGLRWMGWRFVKMTRPPVKAGRITGAVANDLWQYSYGKGALLKDHLVDDLDGRKAADPDFDVQDLDASVLTTPIPTDDGSGNFILEIVRPSNTTDIQVVSHGYYPPYDPANPGKAVTKKSVAMTFRIDKKVKFAIVGKVPIQIGRNTIVEGPVATTITANGKDPLYMLSDFRHLTPDLADKIDAFRALVEQIGHGYDGRISVNNPDEYDDAVANGFTDYNGDQYVDEYDLFVKQFDANGDKAITAGEFTDPVTGKLFDPNLFDAIDGLGALLGEDKNQNGVLDPGEDVDGDGVLDNRSGYNDGKIDNLDGYAKIRGQLVMARAHDSWEEQLAANGKSIYDQITGPIHPGDGVDLPILFSAVPGKDIFDLNPANFEECVDLYKAKTGSGGGSGSKFVGADGRTNIHNAVLSVADANAGWVMEESPKGSRNFQAIFRRPTFKNMNFKNVQIPKGMNALFDNCTFDGVTYVDMERNITNSGGSTSTSAGDGMNWSRRVLSGTSQVNLSGSFNDTDADGKWDQYRVGSNAWTNLVVNPDGTRSLPLTDHDGDDDTPDVLAGTGAASYGTAASDRKTLGSTKGNNLRFNNCTIKGPLTGGYATAYTHFSNSWEFTGDTVFDNTVDDTATIVSPQVNIEMGAFNNPNQNPSKLVGVVVAGNFDIRGTGTIDGSIIVTGDGAANSTHGWFGPSDASTDPGSAMPEGGWGQLNIRYNPNRALPDGINVPIDITPVFGTYKEVL